MASLQAEVHTLQVAFVQVQDAIRALASIRRQGNGFALGKPVEDLFKLPVTSESAGNIVGLLKDNLARLRKHMEDTADILKEEDTQSSGLGKILDSYVALARTQSEAVKGACQREAGTAFGESELVISDE